MGGPLWRNLDFVKLWVGQSVSVLGSQVSQLALPTVAILLLHATPFQVGVLGALEFLAFPVLGLVAGVYADRIRRRRLMIACDLVRLLVLASVPAVWAAGMLRIEQLYFVALVMGVCTVFFDVSYQSYLPSLVLRRDLVDGNSKLQTTRSVAEVSGPAVAGFLIQIVGAAQAVLVDALSYAVSIGSLLVIRRPEPEPGAGKVRTGFWAELREGLDAVFGNQTLWKIAGSSATSNLGTNILRAVLLIFAYRMLHLTPAIVGVAFAIGSIGGVLGALTASPLTRRVGLGLTLFLSVTLAGAFNLLIPLSANGVTVVLLAAGVFGYSLGGAVYNIGQVSLRQSMIPDRLQGRANATIRTVIWGTIPIGTFLGGILGSTIGIEPTLWIGAVVATLAGLWILVGPVRLAAQPEIAPDSVD
ncbi:MAG TPA: MFS transporter [Candidatus Dormibacteraeota bacterium]|nr:MFS transporter [Candidatus Dormibacteraeota bacterium]